jgi:predicted nucleic acid-binding Zn ribbon protein
MSSFTSYIIRRIDEETHCAKCGAPLFVEDSATILNIGDDGKTFCGESCAKAYYANQRRRQNAAAIRDAYDSMGMKRVRGNLGGVYWE